VAAVLILLPPSEGKTAPSRGNPLALGTLSFPGLVDARRQVLDALVALCTTDGAGELAGAASVLGLGSTQLEELGRNAALPQAPTARADRVYSGVLYEALDLGSLDASARRRASSRLATVSALFGLVRPTDRIPAYRLSGGVSLPGIGPVARFWGSRLDQAVIDAVGDGLVVDLRSSTYVPFWRPDPQRARRTATVRVLHEVDGARTVVSHFNKATKGRLVRSLLEAGADARTPARFAEQLRDLGWAVEASEPSRKGTRLDVVVTEM
jgi:cytoplasmic iron level regulating protein YaaA (DUF328/UPF0246 family)